jgi:hypothetical protein
MDGFGSEGCLNQRNIIIVRFRRRGRRSFDDLYDDFAIKRLNPSLFKSVLDRL